MLNIACELVNKRHVSLQSLVMREITYFFSGRCVGMPANNLTLRIFFLFKKNPLALNFLAELFVTEFDKVGVKRTPHILQHLVWVGSGAWS